MMVTRSDAIDRLHAVPLADGEYIYYADETRTHYVVDEWDLDLLAEMLADPEILADPQCRDAYSEWCAATDSRLASQQQLAEIGSA